MKKVAFFILIIAGFSVFGQSDSAQLRFRGIQNVVDSITSSMSNSQSQQTSQQANSARKIKIIKKEIPYATFVSLAMGMLGFIALILTTTQNYNPSE